MKYRMYGMTNYQLTGIQKGIQFGHAVVEYSLLYNSDPAYINWATNDKTFIILDGGTTNLNEKNLGKLNQAANYAEKVLNIPIARFHEPDLGDQLTAFVFLVDERVWDKEQYPNPEYDELIGVDYHRYLTKTFGDYKTGYHVLSIRDWLKGFKLASN